MHQPVIRMRLEIQELIDVLLVCLEVYDYSEVFAAVRKMTVIIELCIELPTSDVSGDVGTQQQRTLIECNRKKSRRSSPFHRACQIVKR